MAYNLKEVVAIYKEEYNKIYIIINDVARMLIGLKKHRIQQND